MVLVAIEAVLAGSKPPAAVSVRISTGERHGFGAAAPLSARASFLQQEIARGSVGSSPKLVRHIGSGSTWAEELSPIITQFAVASSVHLRILVSGFSSASMARRGCRASCLKPAKRCLVSLISRPYARRNGSSFDSAVYRVVLQIVNICPPTRADHAHIQVGERGHCPRVQPCSSFVASQGKPRHRGH